MKGNPNNRFVINERREKVFIMLSQGLNEIEIAKQLNVDQSTICRDLKSIQKESQKKLELVIENVLPFEYRKCMLSMQQIIGECWKIYQDSTQQWTNKNKLDALKLIRETNMSRHEILMEGPFTLRALQMVDKVKELVEESEMPQKSFMNLRLPTIKGQQDEDLK